MRPQPRLPNELRELTFQLSRVTAKLVLLAGGMIAICALSALGNAMIGG